VSPEHPLVLPKIIIHLSPLLVLETSGLNQH
jgi:hypothetical protein